MSIFDITFKGDNVYSGFASGATFGGDFINNMAPSSSSQSSGTSLFVLVVSHGDIQQPSHARTSPIKQKTGESVLEVQPSS